MNLVFKTDSDCPTICLNMIVKNESKIITRLFDSVINIIDCYCICDTGSTDNTVELIKTYFENKNIPGKIVNEPFKNFAHNRNFALKSAIGMSDYILLMDADMILKIINFNKKNLRNFDSFYILQGNDDFYYQNLRIIKNNGLFSYVGVTHEYISTPSNNKLLHITKEELFITDYGDGGCKSDKFERDVRLLTNGIIEEPKNSERYHFYLANSHHDAGNFEKAIDIYEKRIKIGGWEQEIWYSYYRIGLCYKKLGKISNAIYNWLAAYDFLPIRIENLYEIVNHYRNTSKSKLARHFYDMAQVVLKKNQDRDNFLFLHNDVYTYKLEYEFTIFALYIGINNINDQVVKIFNKCNDGSINNNLFSNMKFYKDILKPQQVIDFGNSVSKNINNENIVFKSSSSCLIQNPFENKNGYLMNVRYVNYLINNNGNYLNCDKHIITQNKYLELSKDFKIINEKFLEFNFEDRRYIGVEDIRIFYDSYSNKMQFIGTGYHKNNTIGIVAGDYDTSENKLLSIVEIKPFCQSSCEKNWVFIDYNKSINVVYKWHPLQICKINTEKEILELIETKEMPKIFSHARGSTCGFTYTKKISLAGNNNNNNNNNNNVNIDITFDETEIWFVLHMVSYESPRHYYHMFAVFDESMNLLRYSAPFKFHTEPIEYCLGLVVEDDRVLITYSVWDRETKLGIYDKKYIDSIIKYN
jgi:glycosyltransferase involved in cell wall biosynthesis